MKNKIPGDRLTTADMKLTESPEEISEKGKPETSIDDLSNVIFFKPTEASHRCVICNHEVPNINSQCTRHHYCSFCEIFSWQSSLREDDWTCLVGEQASRKRERDCNGNALDSVGTIGGNKRCPPSRNARANPTRTVPRTRMARRCGEINHPYNTRNRKLELIKRKASQELLMMEPQGLARTVAGEKGSTKKAALSCSLQQQTDKADRKTTSDKKGEDDQTPPQSASSLQDGKRPLSKQVDVFKASSDKTSETISKSEACDNTLKKTSGFFALNGAQKLLGSNKSDEKVDRQTTDGKKKPPESSATRTRQKVEDSPVSASKEVSKMATTDFGSAQRAEAGKEEQTSRDDVISASSNRTATADRGRPVKNEDSPTSTGAACKQTDDVGEKISSSCGPPEPNETMETSKDGLCTAADSATASSKDEEAGQLLCMTTSADDSLSPLEATQELFKSAVPMKQREAQSGKTPTATNQGASSGDSSHICTTSGSGEVFSGDKIPSSSRSPKKGTSDRDEEQDLPAQQPKASATQYQASRNTGKSRQVRQSGITNHPYNMRKNRISGTKLKGCTNDFTVESSVTTTPHLDSETFSYEINFPKDFKLDFEGNVLRRDDCKGTQGAIGTAKPEDAKSKSYTLSGTDLSNEKSSMAVALEADNDNASAFISDTTGTGRFLDGDGASKQTRRSTKLNADSKAKTPVTQGVAPAERSASKEKNPESNLPARKDATAAEESLSAAKTKMSSDDFATPPNDDVFKKTNDPSAKSLSHTTLCSDVSGTRSAVSVEGSASASSDASEGGRETGSGCGTSAPTSASSFGVAGSEADASSESERFSLAGTVVSRDGEVFQLSDIPPSPDHSLSSVCSVWSGRALATGQDSSDSLAAPKESEKFFNLHEAIGADKARRVLCSSGSPVSSIYSLYFGKNAPACKSSAFSLLSPKESKKFLNLQDTTPDNGMKLQDISSSSESSISSMYGLCIGGNNPASKEALPEQKELEISSCSEGRATGHDGSFETDGRRIVSDSSVSSMFSASSDKTVSPRNISNNSLLAPGGSKRCSCPESASVTEGEGVVPERNTGEGSCGDNARGKPDSDDSKAAQIA